MKFWQMPKLPGTVQTSTSAANGPHVIPGQCCLPLGTPWQPRWQQPALQHSASSNRCSSLQHCRAVCHAVSPRTSVPTAFPSASSIFRYPSDHTFNLNEYMVVLDKPIGLVLAPDPTTGQIVVQGIKEGSPAAQTGMIQVGDTVKMCSAVFGEDMWQAADIKRIRWAINNRTSKVKLVLERSHSPHTPPVWYSRGQVGRCGLERDSLQLPVSFTHAGPDDWSQDLTAPGKPLTLTFHSAASSSTQGGRGGSAASAARQRRLQSLRDELAEARREPEMELGLPGVSSRPTGNSSGSGSGSGISTVGGSTQESSGSGSANSSNNMAPGGTGVGRGSNSSTGKSGGSGNGAGSGAVSDGPSTASSNGNRGGPLGRLIETLASGISNSTGGGNSRSNNNNNNGASDASSASQPGSGTAAGSVGAGSAAGSAAGNGVISGQAGPRRGPPLSREKKVTPVLPWLLVTSGRLDTRDLTQIASFRGLSSMLELSLVRSTAGLVAVRGYDPSLHGGLIGGTSLTEVNVSALLAASAAMSAGVGGAGAGSGPVLAMGPASPLPPTSLRRSTSSADVTAATPELRYRCLIHAAASLHRLVIRRRYGSMHHAVAEACNILIHCGEQGLEADVACLFAAWLHWYANMPLQEALLSAEIALGCAIEQGVVEGATETLVVAAEERSNRVVLTWRYGGLTAAVAGDLVGSWGTRMPLMRCKNPLGCKGSVARGVLAFIVLDFPTCAGNFYLELTGLRPGVYCYKYIVDGTWAVDPSAPKVLDSGGNWNNVLEVHPRPPVTSSRERLAMARWHARHLAWENKMGLKSH